MLPFVIIGVLFTHLKAEIINVSFPEEEPVGTVIADLTRGGDYSLYNLNEPYFALSFDGRISIKSRIDRESKPFNDPDDPYELQISHDQTLIQVKMHVIDINDNKPLFKTKRETISFSENAEIGNDIQLPAAIDIDFMVNSTQGYRIDSGNTDNTFDIKQVRAGPTTLYFLELQRALDRERTPSYDLVIIAYDGAHPPKTDTLEVTVIVEDVNDNAPEFSKTKYNIDVPEDTEVDVTILTVKAVDPDAGMNSEVTYKLDPVQNGNNKFYIDKNSGSISLLEKLDYEEEKEIVLIVYAYDKGTPEKNSRVLITVNVVDVNDNHPEIQILYKSATDTEAQVDENIGVDDQVVAIRVTDADSGDAGKVTCEMDSEDRGNEFLKLVRNVRDSDNMWSVVVRKPLQREVADKFTLSITCKDHGSASQQISYTSFKVTVMDVNDHYPVFMPSTYSTEIQENTSPWTDIVRVSATDQDDGPFGEITYRIKSVAEQDSLSNPTAWFDIASDGMIRNLVKLDRETTPEINMVIEAMDGGDPPLISVATVTITLLDQNDNRPTFYQDVFEASVKNDDMVGTEVIQVRARDFDAGLFGTFTYGIDRSTSSSGDHYFDIHQTTGQITVAEVLPNTDYQVITLDVVATDGGGLEGSCVVRVSIFGENRYPPVMQQRDFTLKVKENVAPPFMLTTVHASDRDVQYFGVVHYELTGRHGNMFAIDRDTGTLSVVKALDYEKTRMYRFQVRAFNNYDGTLDKKEDLASIIVNVEDVNDEPPMFEYDRYNLTAYAGDDDGTIIKVIKAVDPDSTDSGKVTYRLLTGNQDLFKLVSTPTGAEIRKNGDLEYLVGNHVKLVLEAQDDNEDAFNGDQTTLWIAVEAGVGPGFYEGAVSDESWFDRYLIYVIVAIVALCLMVIVAIVMVCNRANKQHRAQYASTKLPPYDGFEYGDLDEQYGLEPDTVKAYNIDGGGESDRLSAFEALTSQLQSLQHDYLADKGYNGNGYYGNGYPDKKCIVDSDGYFSLSDPAFTDPAFIEPADKCGGDLPSSHEVGGSGTLKSLLTSQNIYTNMSHPVKCDTKYGLPLSPPAPGHYVNGGRVTSSGDDGASDADIAADFVRCLPPTSDHNFHLLSDRDDPSPPPPPPEQSDSPLPAHRDVMSPPPPPDDHTLDHGDHAHFVADPNASLSSLLSSHPPSEISRLPTSLMTPNQDELLFDDHQHLLGDHQTRDQSRDQSRDNHAALPRDNHLRTDAISINSDHSADI